MGFAVRALLVFGILLGSLVVAYGGEKDNAWRNSLIPTGKTGTKQTLTRNGKTGYRILLPAKPTTQDEKSAEELQRWLKEMTGAEFKIVRERWWPRFGAKYISIGRTRALRRSKLPLASENLGDEGYGIAVKGKRLFLWGGRTRGAINAVFALLEEDLGCRWYSDEHVRIPKRETLTFAPAQRTYVPALKLRDPFYFVSFNEDWSLRNRTNAPWAKVREEWGGSMDYGDRFVHTFHAFLPPAKYFEKHPEYYMLDAAGNRNAHQLCTTNPEVVRLVIESVRRYLKEFPHTEIVSVSKSDGGLLSCLCENCKALDDAEGTNMAALLHLVNKVAEDIEDDYPHVVVSTLAYLETVGVPKTMRPRKNVAIRLCNDSVGAWGQPFTPGEECRFGELLKAWSEVHDKMYIWDYVVNFSHYMAPMPNMEVIAKNIRFMVDNNAEGIMTQGAYQCPGAAREWLRSWVIAKLMWDPSRDLSALMQDFIYGHYGQAAPAIEEYNELLKQQGMKHKDVLANPPGGIRYRMDNPFLSREFLEESNDIFDSAEKLAENDEVLRRVEDARLPVMYVELCRGPEFVGDRYGEALDNFERISKRVGVRYFREGSPDYEEKIHAWRASWEKYSSSKSLK